MPDDESGPGGDESGSGRDESRRDADSTGSGAAPSPTAGPGAALEVATAEAHRTLDEQLDTLEDIDGKAIQLLQFTVGLLGVVVSVVSFTGGSALAAGSAYLAGGMALLVAGAVVAGVTYTVSARVAGVGPADLSRLATTEEVTALSFRRRLVRSYADWIQFNAVANARAALLITVAVLLVVGGALGLALGFLRAFVGPLPSVAVGVAVLGFLVAAVAAGVHRQVRRLRESEQPPTGAGVALPQAAREGVFEGQLCFKGDAGTNPPGAGSSGPGDER